MKQRTILIVDDSTIGRKALSSVFSSDYTVVESESGEIALEKLKSSNGEISLVIMDAGSARKSGLETLDAIRSTPEISDVPVIIVTAAGNATAEIKALELGAEDLLRKPINPKVARKRIEALLFRRDLENVKRENILLLEQSAHQAEMNALFDRVPGGIAVFECEKGNISLISGNAGIYEMFGYDKATDAKTLGNIANLIFPDDYAELARLNLQAEEELKPFSYTARVKKKCGGYIWAMVNVQPIRTDGLLRLYALVTDVTHEKAVMAELKYRAEFDSLTGIYNREAFYKHTAEMLAQNPDEKYVLLRWNIERFKVINDLYGKANGDKVLIEIASVFRSNMPETGTFGRLESDHFATCFPRSQLDVDKMLSIVSGGFGKLEVGGNVVVNVGIYEIDDRGVSVDRMCDRANLALQSVKGNYLRRYAFYNDQLRERLLREERIRSEADGALADGQFTIYLQPVYSISQGRPVSAEALVRWIHPKRGLVSPGIFIPEFEKSGFIEKLDHYVWEEACKYLKSRRDRGLRELPISVNISRKSVYKTSLCDDIAKLTEKYGLSHDLLKLEITESAYTDNPKQLLETVRQLRASGFSVLMDDFGSGYSSLNTLKDMPVDILKIDMKFLEDFETSGNAGSILTSIVRMAKWMGMSVIAEGVETQNQLDFLRSIGCDRIQGYYFAKPMPKDEFERYVNSKMALPPKNSAVGDINYEDFEMLFSKNKLIDQFMSGIFAGIGFCEYSDGKLETIRVNDAYYDMLGYTPYTFIQHTHNVFDNYPNEDAQKLKAACEQSIISRESVRLVISRKRDDGYQWLDGVVRCIGGNEDKKIIFVAFNDITEQRERDLQLEQQKTALSHQHEFLTKLYQSVPCGICQITVTEPFRFISINNACAHIFGYDTPEGLISAFDNGGIASIEGDDLDLVRGMLLRSAEGETVNFEHRIMRADGTYAWIRDTFQPSVSADGESIIQCVFMDVTEQKEAESQREIDRYSTTLYTLFDEIYECDFAENTAVLRASNSRTEFVGKVISERMLFDAYTSRFVCEEDRAAVTDFLERGKAAAKPTAPTLIEYRQPQKDGSLTWMALTMIHIVGDKYLLAGKNIDERKRAEQLDAERAVFESKRREQERNQIIISQTGTVVLELDYLEHTFSATEGFRDFEASSRDPFGYFNPYCKFESVPPSDRAAMHELCTPPKNGESHNKSAEVRLLRTDGRYEWCELNCTYVFENEKLRRTVCSLRSIDGRKKAELELADTNRMLTILMDNAPSAIAMFSVQSADFVQTVYANERFFRSNGYTHAEMVEQKFNVLDLLDEESKRTMLQCLANSVGNGGRRFEQEFRFIVKGGEVKRMHVVAAQNGAVDDAPTFICILTEIA